MSGLLRQEVLGANLDFLPEGKTVETVTPDEAVAAFKKTVEVRDQMGGALYYGIMNEQVHMLYDVCRHHGVEDATMQELYTDLR